MGISTKPLSPWSCVSVDKLNRICFEMGDIKPNMGRHVPLTTWNLIRVWISSTEYIKFNVDGSCGASSEISDGCLLQILIRALFAEIFNIYHGLILVINNYIQHVIYEADFYKSFIFSISLALHVYIFWFWWKYLFKENIFITISF